MPSFEVQEWSPGQAVTTIRGTSKLGEDCSGEAASSLGWKTIRQENSYCVTDCSDLLIALATCLNSLRHPIVSSRLLRCMAFIHDIRHYHFFHGNQRAH